MSMFFTFKYIIDSQKIVNAFYEKTLIELEKKLSDKVLEFDEVTRAASKANTSLGDRVAEFDRKMVDIESRLSMLRMQR